MTLIEECFEVWLVVSPNVMDKMDQEPRLGVAETTPKLFKGSVQGEVMRCQLPAQGVEPLLFGNDAALEHDQVFFFWSFGRMVADNVLCACGE